ncbi:CopG family transcriptional regulator [Trichlorobacter lovleyi]|uniref:CopG family transcriptional regulator n=1 Tax=Trichlorobacter lovleyi TaxID=313985 RepID=UPI003D0F17B5
MPHRMNSTIKEPRKEGKEMKKERTAKNIVSLTLSDKEQRVMERITRATSKEASEVIREALSFWISRRQRLCLDV